MSTIKIVEPTFQPVTLAEAKEHCRIETSDEDSKILRTISAVRAMAEGNLRSTLATSTFECSLDAFPAGEIELINGPVQSILSIKYTDPYEAEQTFPSTDYTLVVDRYQAWAALAYGSSWPETLSSANAVRVRYTAGYAEGACPDEIKEWMLLHIEHLYRNRGAMADRQMMALPYLDYLIAHHRVYS